MRTPFYYEVLAWVHEELRPRTYLEIGVRNGASAALALAGTKVVGVDPCPEITVQLPPNSVVECSTSDEFFASGGVDRAFDGSPIDLAFIDGMHLFEFALRDFLNIERHALRSSVVLVHDCLPRSAAEASRDGEGAGDAWAGDVWKLLAYLIDERPDLDVSVIDAGPTGLAVIRDLDPAGPAVDVEEVIQRYGPLGFEHFSTVVVGRLQLLRGRWTDLRRAFPESPWQSSGRLKPLVADRARRLQPGVSWLRRLRKRLGRTTVGQQVLRARDRLGRR